MELPPHSILNSSSVSDVLTNTDLLKQILLRLGCRSCLVRAALTSKHWLRCASGLVVPEFCARHPPRLVGVYISSTGISGSEFIRLPDASTPEVNAVNHAYFGFGALPSPNVLDCQNGVVLFEFGGDTFHPAGLAARLPLHPNVVKAMELRVAPPPPCFSESPHAVLLSADHCGDALCYRVIVRILESANKVVTAQALVCVWLWSGSWSIRCITKRIPLAKSPVQILPTTVLLDGKIYMATQAGYILGLDLTIEKFFIVDLPEGVELGQYYDPGNLVHCRGDDSVLFLFHVDGDNRLNVWLRRTNDDHGGAGAAGGSANNRWVLRETISVRETCGHLVEQGWETAIEGGTPVMVVDAGDNAEFVFLELGASGVIVYMHLKTKEVKKVYQREPDDDHLISVHPFMLVRPPVLIPPQDAHA